MASSLNASKRSCIWLERLSRTKNETHVTQTHKNSLNFALNPFYNLKYMLKDTQNSLPHIPCF